MTFQQIIEKIISSPGCFVVFEESTEKRQVITKHIKDKKKADRALSVFNMSKKNSFDLLNEAKILLNNKYYARAVALAIMSFEELGKSQIAADYYSGILSESEYKNAFKMHKKTSYANRSAAIGSHEKVKHVYYIDDDVAKILEKIRQSALYVDENNNPLKNFVKDDALMIIKKVDEHHNFIQFAEKLNGRIGSKALFK